MMPEYSLIKLQVSKEQKNLKVVSTKEILDNQKLYVRPFLKPPY